MYRGGGQLPVVDGYVVTLLPETPGTRVPVQIPDGYPGTKIPESPSTNHHVTCETVHCTAKEHSCNGMVIN